MRRRSWLVLSCVLIAAPAFAQEPHRWPLHLALGASITADGADLATSAYAFGRGGFREANPVLRPFQDRPIPFAIAKMGSAAGMSYLLVRLYAKHPRWALALAITNTALKSYIAVRNQAVSEGRRR